MLSDKENQERARYRQLSKDELIQLCIDKDKEILSGRGRLSRKTQESIQNHNRFADERKARITFINRFLSMFNLPVARPHEGCKFLNMAEEEIMYCVQTKEVIHN